MDELPDWFINLYLDFLSDLSDNKDKFKNTGSAKIEQQRNDKTETGYAIHCPSEQILTFIGIQEVPEKEVNYCHINKDYAL